MGRYRVLIRAFNLIEIVVVIAIFSILGLIAFPSYQEHIIRTKIISGTQAIEPVKDEIFKQHVNGVVFGTSTEVKIASGAANKPKYVSQLVRGEYGCIQIEYDLNQLSLANDSGEVLTLMFCPQNNTQDDMMEWVCGYSTDTTSNYVTYLPESCRQAAVPDTSL